MKMRIPKTSLNAFQLCIPSKLSIESQPCHFVVRHFDEDDIVKSKTIQGVFYPNERWFLKPGAMPQYFLKTGIGKLNRILNVFVTIFFVDDFPQTERIATRKINPNIPHCKSII